MNFAESIDDLVEAKDVGNALALADEWTVQEEFNADAWSKLAHVLSLRKSFDAAAAAVRTAIKLKDGYPPYLYKLGTIEFRSGHFDEAADAFGRCAESSVALDDGFYVDAARIARARCLFLGGYVSQATEALEDVPDEASTWLDGEWTRSALAAQIASRPGRTFGA